MRAAVGATAALMTLALGCTPEPSDQSPSDGTSTSASSTTSPSSTSSGLDGSTSATSGVTVDGTTDDDSADDGSESSGGPGCVEPWPPAETFSNPVLWEDLADIDIIRVGNEFYYTASNMHYSPGAPILRSFDLVSWEYAGHAVPVLDFGPAYDLAGGQAYVQGTWASFINYRPSNETYYWGGCIDFNDTHIYTAPSVEGPWERQASIDRCYYDGGLLVDDDDTMYIAYGNTTISVAELTPDGTGEVHDQVVFQTPPEIGTLEGARFYRREGYYYILLTRPPNAEFVIRSDDPFGPYELRPMIDVVAAPVPGAGSPHQGGIVDTPLGDWYYMSFIDAFPGGRVPTLAPVTWTDDGWPTVELVDGGWGQTYPYPDVPCPPRNVESSLGIDTFDGPQLGHAWEWNHNPDDARWSFDDGLVLTTATVTNDLYQARNTLTRRIRGPESTATIELDVSGMSDGDRAGLAMLRQTSASIGVRRSGGSNTVVMVDGMTMDDGWNTSNTGSVADSSPIAGDSIYLRVHADIRPGASRTARFSYSTDGTTFTELGPEFVLNNQWQFFMGYRFAIFNYATAALGGQVTVKSFEVTVP